MSSTRHGVQPGEVDERRLIERGPGYRSGLRDLPRHSRVAAIGAAIVATVFGCTGPALIIINGANGAGLSAVETASWIFGVYVFGGLNSLILALYYKQPIVGAWSIPGAVLVADALGNYTLNEMVGAYLLANLLVSLLALTGVLRRVMRWLPQPIIMAMIAGALIGFAVDVVDSGLSMPWIVLTSVAGYLLCGRFVAKVPGVLGALVFGTVAAVATGSMNGGETDIGLTVPEFVAPSFDLGAIVAVSVPLAVLIVGAENAQATGALLAARYQPPVNTMGLVSGISGLVASIFGGHTANIAGPMTAICSSDDAGPENGRYAASVLNGLLFMAFGISAGAAVALVTALPTELVATVAGLAMITVLLSAFQGAFRERQFQLGAFFALIIAMSDFTVFGISSPFWALLGGVLVSLILEDDQFKQRRERAAA